MEKDLVTEAVIKEKAKALFFQKGFLDATTQEIADAAGVNRALIHYYFRSREQLMDTILEEVVAAKRRKVRAIFSSELGFREKIALYIHTVVDLAMNYPYLDNFIINETARNQEKLKLLCAPDKIKTCDMIRAELAHEVTVGNMPPVTPEQFLVNLAALCNYPLLAKTVLKSIHGMTDQEYKKFLLSRKEVIYRTIFNEDMAEVKPTAELKSILA